MDLLGHWPIKCGGVRVGHDAGRLAGLDRDFGMRWGAKHDVRIEVTAKRWWWDVRYPDDNVASANEVHVPVDRPVDRSATPVGIARSRNGTPRRRATSGPTWLPPAP